MGNWILAGYGFVFAGILIAYLFGRARDTRRGTNSYNIPQ